MPIETILNQFFAIATRVCDETLAFRPDVVIGLMHSGWMPLFAGKELWQRTQQTPFPPIVRVNLGREKLKRFDELENQPGVTDCFVGEFELDHDIAFFLAWLHDQIQWQEELRACIQAAIGDVKAPCILIVDDMIHEGTTWLLTMGLLNLLYPKSKVRFYSANIEWKDTFFDAWIEARHPELLETELCLPEEQRWPLVPAREAAIQMVLGTENMDPESLDWKVIGKSSPNMEPLSKYLSITMWMELPRFVEQAISNEIAARIVEYVPNLDILKDPQKRLQPGWLVMREIYRHGPLTAQQISKLLGWSAAKSRYHVDRQLERGFLVVKQERRVHRYVLSPRTEPKY